RSSTSTTADRAIGAQCAARPAAPSLPRFPRSASVPSLRRENDMKGTWARAWRPGILPAAVLVWSVVLAGPAAASGFALWEQSASGLGNAFAGAAAVAEDASTVYWNPAGLSRLGPGRHLAVAL